MIFMGGGWAFGLLREKDGSLVLCEMYDMEKYGWGAATVDLKQARKDWKMILHGLRGQFSTRTEFHVMADGKIRVRRKGRWSKRKTVPFDSSKVKWHSHEEVMRQLFPKRKARTKN